MPPDIASKLGHDLWQLIPTLIYTAIGILVFGLAVWLVCRAAPFSVRKEIEEDQNIALGIIIGAMILGIAVIIAAVIISG